VTRRVPSVPLALLTLSALVGLGGCATFTNVDRVASVNGTDIGRSEFEAMTVDYFAHPELFGTTPPADGRGSADNLRALLAIVTQARLLHEVADADQLADAKQAALEALPEGDPVLEMSPEMQNLYSDLAARQTVLGGVAAPSSAELERRYVESPASAGVLCVRHILVDTEAEARQASRRLADGEDFATLAAEVSLDTVTGADGGAVPGSMGPCWTLGEAFQGLVPEFVHHARALSGLAPSAPFETQYGWHIVASLPWSEVGEAVAAIHAPGSTGDVQYVAALFTADVEVDPAYGVWDSGTVEIVPIG